MALSPQASFQRPASTSPQVVVITGASSGIGHATALAFAQRGARVVLAARDADTLEPVAEACRAAGAASALVVPTDVTDAEAVGTLAQTALTQHGHIDIWINGVGVGAVGLFDETPLAAHRRVIESNLIGHMHGAHAALRHFKKRGRGTLINMISVGGWIPAPYAAAYTASKFGLRGLSEALRAEVSDLPQVHVCDVAPTVVDSPGLLHGANYTMVDPRRVARAVVALSSRPRAITWVGASAGPGRLAHAIAPQWVGAAMQRTMRWALGRAQPVARTDGNLFESSKGTQIDGGQRHANKQAAGTVAALGVLGLAAVLWMNRRPARPLPTEE